MMASETVDAKGLNCPMPVLHAKKALKKLSSGDTLEVLATDPSRTDWRRAEVPHTGKAVFKIVLFSIDRAQARKETSIFE